MSVGIIINIIVFIALLYAIYKLSRKHYSLSVKVFSALIIGVIFGIILQAIYGASSSEISSSMLWFNIVGNGYVALLQMVIMPLVLISILSAVSKLRNASSLGKIAFFTIGLLLFTTLIAAIVGVLMVKLFGLSAAGLVQGTVETARLNYLENNQIAALAKTSYPQMILSFLPQNPFADLAGMRPTSVIAVVIFATFLGVAALRLHKDDEEKGNRILAAIDVTQMWVTRLVRLVITLTPFGVFALITKVVATSDLLSIIKLATFIIASYIGLAIMFGVHAGILSLSGINPIRFFRKVFPVLIFAFTSRSSAATIPLSIEVQTRRLGVPQSIASFAASFGATLGQNGCAGLYPAMLAAMVAPTIGINPLDPTWFLSLIVIVTISSLGVAGVGGGATFAALIVLPIMGLPVTLVALLISIEPLIDMGRTALNVNGAIVAGTLTSSYLRQSDQSVFNGNDDKELSQS